MQRSIYRKLKDVWQKLSPETRNKLRTNPIIKRMIRDVSAATISSATHQEIYDESYYRQIDDAAQKSAPIMAESIARVFNPARVIDVGCGGGSLLSELRRRGVDVVGFEYSERGIEMSRVKGLTVHPFDLESTSELPVSVPFDIACSFEVAEHLPACLADRFVEIMTCLSPVLVVSAATPGQGGLDHVNEQPHEYWIEKFLQKGAIFDQSTTEEFRAEWRLKSIASWYAENVMIFKKSS